MNDFVETYHWPSSDSLLQYRDPSSYKQLYEEDWRTLVSKYGDEQLTIIYDWLYKRISKLAWGQYIVIEKDAVALTTNLWLKGKYVQWNIPDDERIANFRWIAFLLIEWIWRNNCVAIWSITECDGETRLNIVEPDNDERRALYIYFGHWPLSQPPPPFVT